MNIPNKLTILRVILVPVFMAFMLAIPENTAYVTVSLVIFIIASLTDTFDGYIARKNNLVTNFGKLMDPLADKVLTTAAYLGLLSMGRASSWAVMLILTREFMVSGIRLVAAGNGTVIAASVWGKAKTIFQMVSIIAAFFFGPKIFKPLSINKSTIPVAKLASGPTTVKSILLSRANLSNASLSVTLIFIHFAFIPAFPGAAKISGLCLLKDN